MFVCLFLIQYEFIFFSSGSHFYNVFLNKSKTRTLFTEPMPRPRQITLVRFYYPKKSLFKSSHPKKKLAKFSYPKKCRKRKFHTLKNLSIVPVTSSPEYLPGLNSTNKREFGNLLSFSALLWFTESKNLTVSSKSPNPKTNSSIRKLQSGIHSLSEGTAQEEEARWPNS